MLPYYPISRVRLGEARNMYMGDMLKMCIGFALWSGVVAEALPIGFRSLSITIKTGKYPPIDFSMDSTGAAEAKYFISRHPDPESLYQHRDNEQYMRRFWFIPKSDTARLDAGELERISGSIGRLLKKPQDSRSFNKPKAIFLEIDAGKTRLIYVWDGNPKNKLFTQVLCTAFIDTEGVRGRYFSYVNGLFNRPCPVRD